MEHKNCLCGNTLSYEDCCKKFHENLSIPSPEEVVRSRFVAFAMGLTNYLLATTHPEHEDYQKNLEQLKTELEEFSKNTKFLKLTIKSSKIALPLAYVTFEALLSQGASQFILSETSIFKRLNTKWLYLGSKSLQIKHV